MGLGVSDGIIIGPPASGGGGSGTVTSFTSGDASPFFTTSVATGTTTPVLGFVLTDAPANSVWANLTASPGPASYSATTGTGNIVRVTSPTVAGTWTFSGAISCAGTVSALRLRPTGAVAPTIVAGAGSGSALNAAVSILAGSNNTVGQITCVTGVTPTAGAVIATITFNGSVSPSPMVAMLQASNANAATFMPNVFTTAPSTTTWTITSGTVPLTAGLTYIWFYTVI